MTESIVNLLIAIFLLAANAFYVAAEFALVKSRGFRINAMVEQNRFAARLLQQMLGNIEAYLGAAASSASRWPRSALAGSANRRFRRCSSRCWCRSGCPTRRVISRRSWSVSWCSPRCIS